MKYTITSSVILALVAPSSVAVVSAQPGQPDQPVAATAAAESESDRGSSLHFGLIFGAIFADMGGEESQQLIPSMDDATAELAATEKLLVGAMVAIPVSGSWSVRIEALLASKGVLADETLLAMLPGPDGSTIDGVVQYQLEHTLNYVEVPILAQYELYYDGAIRPVLYAGVAPAFLWGADLDGDGQLLDAGGTPIGTLTASGEIDDISESFDISVLAGADIAFPLARGAVVFGVRYQFGLLAAIDGDFDAMIATDPELPVEVVPVNASSLRNRGLSLIAGYQF